MPKYRRLANCPGPGEFDSSVSQEMGAPSKGPLRIQEGRDVLQKPGAKRSCPQKRCPTLANSLDVAQTAGACFSGTAAKGKSQQRLLRQKYGLDAQFLLPVRKAGSHSAEGETAFGFLGGPAGALALKAFRQANSRQMDIVPAAWMLARGRTAMLDRRRFWRVSRIGGGSPRFPGREYVGAGPRQDASRSERT